MKLYKWFKSQTLASKLIISILLVISIYAIVVTIQKGIYKYKYFKAIEKEYKIAVDSIEAKNLLIKKLSEQQEKRTKNFKDKSKATNDKLKKDEETIDNSVISDDDLSDFIAKHEKG